MTWRIGTKVKVSSDNDNENYNDFRNKVLKITHIAKNTNQHSGYDNSMEGMPLYDLEALDGTPVNCSLYEYELEKA